jgi:hypothetical protein
MRLDIYQDVTLRTLLQKEIDRQIGQLGALIEGRSAEVTKISEQLHFAVNEKKKFEDQSPKEENIIANFLCSAVRTPINIAKPKEIKYAIVNLERVKNV